MILDSISPKGIARAKLIEANIGEDYWEVDLSSFRGDSNAKASTKRYLEKLGHMKKNGVGILYVGSNGPGKTTLAMIALKYLLRANWDCFATSLGELVENIQKGWKDDDEELESYRERCRGADFLLIDDVGKEHRGQSGFVQTVFDNLIRYRVQHRKPVFITTNYTKDELRGTYGESVMSLLEGKLLPVLVSGKDYRRDALKHQIRKSFNE